MVISNQGNQVPQECLYLVSGEIVHPVPICIPPCIVVDHNMWEKHSLQAFPLVLVPLEQLVYIFSLWLNWS